MHWNTRALVLLITIEIIRGSGSNGARTDDGVQCPEVTRFMIVKNNFNNIILYVRTTIIFGKCYYYIMPDAWNVGFFHNIWFIVGVSHTQLLRVLQKTRTVIITIRNHKSKCQWFTAGVTKPLSQAYDIFHSDYDDFSKNKLYINILYSELFKGLDWAFQADTLN